MGRLAWRKHPGVVPRRLPRGCAEGHRSRFAQVPLILLSLSLSVGCASVSPLNQDFVEVRTPHFSVTSSLGDSATRSLVHDLEVFYAGMMFALGFEADQQADTQTSAPNTNPIRVLAFDDRGVSRPFAVRGAAASWIPGVDTQTLVLRTPGSFSESVSGELRHRVAHRLLRDRSENRSPLWYEEGRAQIVRTLKLEAYGVQVGRWDSELREAVVDWRLSGWRGVLGERDLSERNPAGHDLFEARAWALVHALLFDAEGGREGARGLERIRLAAEAGDGVKLDRLVRLLGSDEDLETRVYDHLDRDRHRVERVRVVGITRADLSLRPVSAATARIRLGRLALELERPSLAKGLFERALEQVGQGPTAAEAELAATGRAHAEALLGEVGALGALGEGVEALDSAAAAAHLGWALLAGADSPDSTDEADAEGPAADRKGQASGRLERARRSFRRSLLLRPDWAEPHLGLAQIELRPGGDLERARRELEAAREKAPGSLEIDYWLARTEAIAGRRAVVEIHLGEILSRSHSPGLRRRAEAFLSEMKTRPSGD